MPDLIPKAIRLIFLSVLRTYGRAGFVTCRVVSTCVCACLPRLFLSACSLCVFICVHVSLCVYQCMCVSVRIKCVELYVRIYAVVCTVHVSHVFSLLNTVLTRDQCAP